VGEDDDGQVAPVGGCGDLDLQGEVSVGGGDGDGLDGDEPARTEIEAQDRAIAEKSRLPPLEIKTLKRSGK
jgi:hypothetical protein